MNSRSCMQIKLVIMYEEINVSSQQKNEDLLHILYALKQSNALARGWMMNY